MAVVQLAKFVKRYTTLSSALQTLSKKKLVLLSPSKWDDSNDSYFMELYRESIAAPAVAALCATMGAERYHHWRVFTDGMEGVCIEFKREPLEAALELIDGVSFGPVEYLTIEELAALSGADGKKLPFVKRIGYGDEREWRIVARCADELQEHFDVPIELSWIHRIVLNPWMPEALAQNLREIMLSLASAQRLPIESSRLTNNPRWKRAGLAIARNQ